MRKVQKLLWGQLTCRHVIVSDAGLTCWQMVKPLRQMRACQSNDVGCRTFTWRSMCNCTGGAATSWWSSLQSAAMWPLHFWLASDAVWRTATSVAIKAHGPLNRLQVSTSACCITDQSLWLMAASLTAVSLRVISIRPFACLACRVIS